MSTFLAMMLVLVAVVAYAILTAQDKDQGGDDE